jgi:DNA replication and repair protein RecF
MILRSLLPQNFRNLVAASVEFHPHANLLVGRNGQGKTNLLEAIYFLCTTKSFRTSRVASLFRFGSANLYVAGALARAGLTKTISAGFEWGESKRRVLMVNEEKVTLPAFLNAASVFAYSASRLEILRGAPEEKRRFLDRGVASVNPAYLEQLTRYTRVLKQRNALLHDVAVGRQSQSTLDAWDAELVTAAAVVHAARGAYAVAVAKEFRDIVAAHGYHVANVEMAYKPSLTTDLPRIRRDEIRARTSLVGPQRDVLEFAVDGRPAAEVLSGGEGKMIVLFLKFAKLELYRQRHDEPPLFLLDDIDAELDFEILQKLLTKLPAFTQVFATSAKEAFLQALSAGPHRRLTVENGAVTALRDFE